MNEQISARHLLRQRTGDLHAELDGILSHTDFDDRRSYADFLKRQAGPLFVIEHMMEQSPLVAEFPDWPDRRRSVAMGRDLATLGAAMPPKSLPNDELEGTDQLFGALYVLEGSRLGAKYLVRQARASRDATVRAATAYLAHGEGAPFWPTFLKALAAREARDLDPAMLVEGARSAFGLFLDSAKGRLSV